MGCLGILSIVTVCLLLSSWSSIVVADKMCAGVGVAFTPCLPYFDHDGGPGPSKPCCAGIEKTKGFSKTKDQRMSICKCLITLLEKHNPKKFINVTEKCKVNLKIPSVEAKRGCIG